MKVTLRFIAAARLFIVPLVGAAWLASASHAASNADRSPARVSSAPANRMAAGMLIGIDPETGQLAMVTPEQMAKLSAVMGARAIARSERSAPIRHADGRVSMFVGNWMREYSVVRIGADGRLVLGCVDGPDAAAYLKHAPAAAAGAEDR